MPSSKSKKVSVVFLNKPNLESLGLKFVVLYLNKIQQCFEFEFPEMDEYPIVKNDYNDPDELLIKLSVIIKEKKFDSDYSIGIVSGEIGKNWFWATSASYAIITTKDWKKTFAPPSVLEYVVRNIVGVLALMMDESGTLDSHSPTRGCCLDYTYWKEEARVGTVLGYICINCKSKIKEKLGENVLECLEKINSKDWLGEVEEKGTVAYDLKKILENRSEQRYGFY